MGKNVYMLEDYYKWIIPNYEDRVIKDGCLRFEVAREEAKKKKVEINEIVAVSDEMEVTAGLIQKLVDENAIWKLD